MASGSSCTFKCKSGYGSTTKNTCTAGYLSSVQICQRAISSRISLNNVNSAQFGTTTDPTNKHQIAFAATMGRVVAMPASAIHITSITGTRRSTGVNVQFTVLGSATFIDAATSHLADPASSSLFAELYVQEANTAGANMAGVTTITTSSFSTPTIGVAHSSSPSGGSSGGDAGVIIGVVIGIILLFIGCGACGAMAYFQFRARAAEEEARPKNGMEMQVVGSPVRTRSRAGNRSPSPRRNSKSPHRRTGTKASPSSSNKRNPPSPNSETSPMPSAPPQMGHVDQATLVVVDQGFSAEDKSTAQKLFARFDLDSSGTLNSSDEAMQLLTGLCYTLKVPISAEALENKAGQIMGHDDPMDFDEFWQWFVTTFPRCDDKDNGAGAY